MAPAPPHDPPGVWGPPRWQWLHLEAISYPDAPAYWHARTALARLGTFVRGLPCHECRKHACEYARANPPDLRNSETYQAWTWRFHNTVNWRKNKPVMSADAFRSAYADEREWAPLIRHRYPTIAAVPAES